MTQRTTLGLAAALLAAATPLAADSTGDPCLVVSCGPDSKVGVVAGVPTAVTLATSGSRVYGAYAEITIYEVADPTAPELIATLDFDVPLVRDLVVSDDHAYLATGSDPGLVVVALTSPSGPAVVGELGGVTFFGEQIEVYPDGEHVLLQTLGPRLRAVDVSDPTSPVSGPALTLDFDGSSADLWISSDGTAAYVAMVDRLSVVDVSNPPTVPTEITSVPLPNPGEEVAVAGDFAYVATSAAELHVIAIDQVPPVIVNTIPLRNRANSMTIADETLYAGLWSDDGTDAYALAPDPTAPRFEGSTCASGGFVTVVGDHLVTVGGGVMRVFDRTALEAQERVATVPTPDVAAAVARDGAYAYIAASTAGVEIFDVSDPECPVLVGNVPATRSTITSVLVHDGIAYIGETGVGVRIVDVSAPAVPVELGLYAPASDPRGFDLAGDLLHVAAGPTFTILDVGDPTAPSLVGATPVPDAAWSVQVTGDLAHVAAGEDYLIIDVSAAASPAIIGTFDIPTDTRDVHVQDGLALVAQASSAQPLYVVDVTNPAAPTFVWITGAIALWGIDRVGDVAVLAGGGGLQLIDVAVPTDPVLLGAVSLPGSAFDVTVRDGTAFIASVTEGLVVATLDCLPETLCPADLDGSGEIGFGDLLLVLSAWSDAGGDVTGDGTTDFADLLAVLSAWGPC